MNDRASTIRRDALMREAQLLSLLKAHFARAGWNVDRSDTPRELGVDLILARGREFYAAEVKVVGEGSSGRLIPAWSQACLQVLRGAGKRRPLAIVAAPSISPRAAEKVLSFAAAHAPEVAAGVIDLAGLRRFQGPHLEDLDVEELPAPRNALPLGSGAVNLFSDLNQWMLKVLLAPELPASLLSAPRGRYRNASELAEAAAVSVMSAYRFVQQLKQEGYLSEGGYLRLVRRESLASRWQAAAFAHRVKEVRMKVLLREDPQRLVRRLAHGDSACLAYFAAAEALGFGLVHGVTPYLYLPRLDPKRILGWRELVPARKHEPADLLIRQAPAPQSVFRGMVQVDQVSVSDVLQVWIDVSQHPARGKEQADLIHRRVLQGVFGSGVGDA